MIILGIETSCDETAAAVVQDGTKLLSNVVASQMDIHAQYGGVVPEVAARSHIEVMIPVVEEALAQAFSSRPGLATNDPVSPGLRPGLDELWNQIDAIAVTQGPGLIGSLLVGTLTASTLAHLKNKPLIPINHVEAHVYANFLVETPPAFPLLALIVSGGHTQLVLFQDHGDYKLLGQTQDDAAGEAFDKVAKIIGLGYPGGPSIAKAAEQGSVHAFAFPKPKTSNPLDFSFSGLKTAVLREAQDLAGGDYTMPSTQIPALISDNQRNDIAASFQKTVVEILCDHLLASYNLHHPKSVVIAGGVAANQELRRVLKERLPIGINYAPINLCTDNAAMIASCGYFHRDRGVRTAEPVQPLPVLTM